MIKERLVKLRFGEMTSLFYVVKNNFRITLSPSEQTSDKPALHIPEHTRSLSGSLLGYKTIP